VSQPHSPLLAYPARSSADSASWFDPRFSEVQSRALGALLAISALMLSWHIVRLGTINLTLSDIALIGCVGLLLIHGKLEPMPFGSLTPLWLLGLTMMQGGLLVSTLLAGEPVRWLIVFAQYLLAYFLLPAVLMSVSRELVWRLLVAFLLGVTVSQAITLTASLFLDYQDTADLLGLDFITATGRIGAFCRFCSSSFTGA
jgi:hypothetical protein